MVHAQRARNSMKFSYGLGTGKSQTLLVPCDLSSKTSEPPVGKMGQKHCVFLRDSWCVHFRHCRQLFCKVVRILATELKTSLSHWYGLRKGLIFLIEISGQADQWKRDLHRSTGSCSGHGAPGGWEFQACVQHLLLLVSTRGVWPAAPGCLQRHLGALSVCARVHDWQVQSRTAAALHEDLHLHQPHSAGGRGGRPRWAADSG